jgi:hypothetical protein
VAVNKALAASLFNSVNEKVKKSMENMKISKPTIIVATVIRFFIKGLASNAFVIQ